MASHAILLLRLLLSHFAMATESLLLGNVEVRTPLAQIRVLVFPHIGHYVRPHGREAQIDEVHLRTAGGNPGKFCRGYLLSGSTPEWERSEVHLTFSALQDPLRIECDGPTEVLRGPGLGVRSYLGSLYARREWTSDGLPYVQLVHQTGFEDYLKGVVPAEVPATWHAEALKAQAVAARSYAYFQAQRVRRYEPRKNYDVDDTILYQAYLGHSGRAAATDEAVNVTRGELLTYQNRVVKAYFHADSGGHTESAENVWTGDAGKVPYCQGKAEAYDPALYDSRWASERSLLDLDGALKEQGILTSQQWLSRLEIPPLYFPSGRPRSVVATLDAGRSLRIPAERFRFAAALRSTWFEIIPLSTSAFRLNGLGYGHGVGMSQWGAQLSARTLGWNYEQILRFYYSGAEIGTRLPLR